MTELKPCPMCGQSLQPFWGRNDERKLNVAGHVHPDESPIVCVMDGFVVYPQNYDKWNRRPVRRVVVGGTVRQNTELVARALLSKVEERKG